MWKPLGISYSVSCLVRPVSPELLLNNLKCQSFLGFRTAVSKRVFVLMGNSLPSVAECNKPLDFFFKFCFLIPDYFPNKNLLQRWCFPLGLKIKIKICIRSLEKIPRFLITRFTYRFLIYLKGSSLSDPEVLVLIYNLCLHTLQLSFCTCTCRA